MQNCALCTSSFEHLSEDLEFYEKHEFTAPDTCPDCRHQARCAYRNERVMYRRDCDLCKKSMVTIFSGDRPFPVYCPECWWGDGWRAEDFGMDFDFNRPFFEQFRELQDRVPHLSLNNAKHENSDYCSQCVGNKNSYLLFAADDNEDCMYSYWINRCKDVYNSSWLADCTFCFDVIDSENCYKCVYSQDLKNCSDCYFSYDLIGCNNCFGCSGLRNKEYHINNQPYSKEQYEEKMKQINLGSYSFYSQMKEFFPQYRQKIPHKYAHITNSENCVGDYIIGSKDCNHCFDIFDAENCRYAFNLVHQHYNVIDASYVTETRNAYQVMSTVGEEIYFCTLVWYSSNAWYCDLVQQSHNMFACVGMKKKKHCIFNRQYSEGEFNELRSKIIEYMKLTGEWGKFFPVENSIFAYNETVAQDFFPMTKEAVLARGWGFKEEDERNYLSADYEIPDNIKDVSDLVVEKTLACTDCGKNYKILPKELSLYEEMNLPISRECVDCRFHSRLKMRNPHKLYNRTCHKCDTAIWSTYAPDSPEIIYCEKCYLETVY